ncbi:MAG TPA: DUF4430 domain-containing protein [Thermoleophilaceae bacterium]
MSSPFRPARTACTPSARATSARSRRGSKSARQLLSAAAICAALILAACGVGPGKELDGAARLEVTRDFGQRFLGGTARIAVVHESDTVMRFLEKTHDVETSYGGGFVDSIDGVRGDKAARRDWFYYVNGIEASKGAADFELSPGDRIQWDHRSWTAAMRVPVIVGAYPEPMVNGQEGRRLPVRVQCERENSEACQGALRRLSDSGVIATQSSLQGPAGEHSVRVLVGRWSALREVRGAAGIERGPRASGVFARFRGDSLELLDGDGRVARTAAPGTGLVAATETGPSGIVWVVTGVDDAGVERAVEALDERKLHGAYAVAETERETTRLPIVEGSGE